MSGNLLLDWATMAVSLFNTILTLWLGLTVLLNAERRTFGIWLAGGGLLLGAAFFFSHTAILGLGQMPYRANLWWKLGWIPVILAPYAWYVVMLWYAGFWEQTYTQVHRRHRFWFWLLSLVSASMLLLFLIANPLPTFGQVRQLNFSATPSVMGIPILIVLYPLFILSSIGLSLDALLHPGPTIRMMGQLARRRARPWLIAASGALLVVGLFVSVIMFWILSNTQGVYYDAYVTWLVGWTDLLIASLIALAILLTGQAIVVYEVFTGKTLPRRGLKRYWQRAIILAAGYSSAVGFTLTLRLPPIYSLLLSTVLMVGFYALLSWRSYLEREHYIEQLRPFIASQNLYERLLNTSSNTESQEVRSPFEALCTNILGARTAILVPHGTMAPLFGPALIYPQGAAFPVEQISEISSSYDDPGILCHTLSSEEIANLSWAIPLWNERGLCGALFLGAKMDQGLYTQEEMEIARAAGERLIDIQAGAEMSRRLMTLQRHQMVTSQVIDRQTRRVLHDDVLPELHACMIGLHNMQIGNLQEGAELLATLAQIHHQIADLLRDIPTTTASDVDRLGLLAALQQLTQTELKGAFDQVDWQISPQASQNITKIPPLTSEVLFYAVRESMRNAVQHGRSSPGTETLILRIHVAWEDGLDMTVENNGADIAASKQQQTGSGQGLALHSTLLAVVGGYLSIEKAPENSFRIRFRIPPQALISEF